MWNFGNLGVGDSAPVTLGQCHGDEGILQEFTSYYELVGQSNFADAGLGYCQEVEQEAQLSPSDRAMRLVTSNLASCHAKVQKLLIRQVLTKLMV